MTGRIEKTVFISYRRDNVPWALAIFQSLTMHGYDVFFDYQSIDSGNFEKVIVENIKARAHFLVILTPSALERCKEPTDWLRREIETAIDEKRNIIPLMLESFDFGSPLVKQTLTGKLATLSEYNGLLVPSEYFLEAMDRLRDRYLKVALSDMRFPTLNTEAMHITEIQKTAANDAPPVEEDELTAQEWLERGYVFWKAKDFDEAIRCNTESIRLNQQNATAYNNRGFAYYNKNDLDAALADFAKAIELDPNYYYPYGNRAVILQERGDLESAIRDYDQWVRIKSDDAAAYYKRGAARAYKGDLDGAIADFSEAVSLKSDYADAYNARGNLYSLKGDKLSALSDYEKACELQPEYGIYRALVARALKSLGRNKEARNKDRALELLTIWIAKTPLDKSWARQDPDFENIRDDSRFKELVGE